MNKKQSAACIGIGILLVGLILTSPQIAHSQKIGGTPVYLPFISRPQVPFGCNVFPSDNVWNHRVDALPVDGNSAAYINSIGAGTHLHPDFGTVWDGGPIGIPYNLVSGSQPKVNVTFDYADESDPGPYPIPSSPKIEYGSDHHILIVDQSNCILYEMWDSRKVNGVWHAGSGAIFDLKSNALRPSGWTSADAAGLPILPGLVTYDEVASGVIKHAIRFTIDQTRDQFIWPARHLTTGSSSPNIPQMGQRFRLKASVNITHVKPEVQVIFQAFKDYGLIVADNGSNWYISGAPDMRWIDDDLVTGFNTLKGSDFEAVNESSLQVSPDSGQTH